MSLLFVYGTLRAGGSNAVQMRGARLVGPARTVPGFVLVRVADYPGLIAAPVDRGVVGEVWEVSPEHLRQLDAFEDVPSGLYRRAPIALAEHPEGVDAQVDTYFYARDVSGLPVIGADWLAATRSSRTSRT